MRLILICVLNPTQLGFDINNEEINKKLPERVSCAALIVIGIVECIYLDS